VADTNEQFAIETFSLTKIFKDWWGRNKVVAVEDVNLKVRRHEIFGLLGPNGSGKTTIIKMLLSLLHPTKGGAVVLGGSSRDPKISAKIGFLPEESYLYPYLNAREILDFYGRLFGLGAKLRKARIDALLEMVGLEGMASRPVGTFSKGMARRIGLAQSLINDPDLLILDEPTSGLDPIGTRQIKDLIIELGRRGKTVLLCSHLLADAEEVCDRMAIMYGGHIQKLGTAAELLKQSDKRQITTSAVSDELMNQIRDLIAKTGAESQITTPMEKLESVFIDIIKQARQQRQPTSGATNKAELDETQRIADVASVLDKLVAASVEQKPAPASVATEPVEVAAPAANTDMLEGLTQTDTVITPEPVTKTESVQSHSIPEKEEIKKGLLENLTKDNQDPDNTEGSKDV